MLAEDTSQRAVFEGTPIKSSVVGVARGISTCIFAYGQTSAGKVSGWMCPGIMGSAVSNECAAWEVSIPTRIYAFHGSRSPSSPAIAIIRLTR